MRQCPAFFVFWSFLTLYLLWPFSMVCSPSVCRTLAPASNGCTWLLFSQSSWNRSHQHSLVGSVDWAKLATFRSCTKVHGTPTQSHWIKQKKMCSINGRAISDRLDWSYYIERILLARSRTLLYVDVDESDDLTWSVSHYTKFPCDEILNPRK